MTGDALAACTRQQECITDGGPCACLELEAQELAAAAEAEGGDLEHSRTVLAMTVRLEVTRWNAIQLLGWIHAQGYEPGRIPWLDDVIAQIEQKVTHL